MFKLIAENTDTRQEYLSNMRKSMCKVVASHLVQKEILATVQFWIDFWLAWRDAMRRGAVSTVQPSGKFEYGLKSALCTAYV